MKNLTSVIWGLVFIIVGVIFGLNTLNITDINIFFDGWWTLFIIIPCFINLFKEGDKKGNIIGLLIGVLLLLASLNVINFEIVWKLLVPGILIIIGLSMVFENSLKTKFNDEIRKINQSKNKENEYCATFGEQKINFDDEKFEGTNISAVFGSIKCDLRKAEIKKDVVINASAIFGGIEILVSNNVKVKVKSSSMFGGASEKKRNVNEDKNTPTIYVNATCLFGGVEIK